MLWCVVLGIRARTTPALARMAATGTPTEPAETLLGAALGGLFAAFALVTSLALVAIGAALAIGGGVAAPSPGSWRSPAPSSRRGSSLPGDIIPAVLYVPTLLVGLALLAGWT